MELYIKLGLKEIATIVQTLGASTEIESLQEKINFVDNTIT